MSSSGVNNDSSPGGEIPTLIPFVDDRHGRSMLSWNFEQGSKAVVRWCHTHGPHDECHCEIDRPCTPLTSSSAQAALYDRPPLSPARSRGSGGSLSSNSTVDDFFERPSASPRLADDQLPPLCGDTTDWEDEGYEGCETPATTADGMLLLGLSEPRDTVRPGAPVSETGVLAPVFTFVAPSNAPKFPSPLRVECRQDSPAPEPAALENSDSCCVADIDSETEAKSLDKPLYHRRPSCDSGPFQSDQSVVKFLEHAATHPRVSDVTIHQRLVQSSDECAVDSYRHAGKCVQRFVRTLMLACPWMDVDLVTPFAGFPCVYPHCDIIFPVDIDAEDAQAHLDAEHAPPGSKRKSSKNARRTLACPDTHCTSRIQLASLGRHMAAKHFSAEVPTTCKLCGICSRGTAEPSMGHCQPPKGVASLSSLYRSSFLFCLDSLVVIMSSLILDCSFIHSLSLSHASRLRYRTFL
ncbi:hypothetical protein C8R47DRAFT_1205203 [Mycena vitilis]|nr:hypothetical protein C8R47DRAFT_1205203 [Mycena vitilis]